MAVPIVAFANADGGAIAIGVSDKTRKIEGIDQHTEKLNELLRVPFDFCNPSVPVTCSYLPCTDKNGNENRILLMEIPASSSLHTNQADEAFMRVGDKSRKLTFDERVQLMYDKGERYYEDTAVYDATIDDIDMDAVADYAKLVGYGKSPLQYLQENNGFVRTNTKGEEEVSTACILLFGKYPQKFFPRTRTRFIRYEGVDEKVGAEMNVIKDVTFEGTILNQVKKTIEFEYGQILKEMHTSLYEEVGSKYGLDRGDSIDGRYVQHLGKRDYIRKLNKDIHQSERAIKGLKSMLTNLQTQIEERQKQLEDLEGKLRSGKIHLQDYEDERKSLQRQIVDLHNKVYDKMAAIGRKESELAKLTKEVDAVSSVIQPFRNHKIEFDPPRITEKPPLFGVDKWLDKQNDQIAKRFTSIVRKIESLYMQDAERQVKAAQKNVLADYRELNQLRGDYESLTDSSHQQDFAYRQLLDQLSVPSLRVQVLAIADALIGGKTIPFSGGGGASTSDLRWDGRNLDEEEDAYRRRCLLQASKMVDSKGIKRKR